MICSVYVQLPSCSFAPAFSPSEVRAAEGCCRLPALTFLQLSPSSSPARVTAPSAARKVPRAAHALPAVCARRRDRSVVVPPEFSAFALRLPMMSCLCGRQVASKERLRGGTAARYERDEVDAIRHAVGRRARGGRRVVVLGIHPA